MAWMATTRWTDHQVNTVDEAINHFMLDNEILETESGNKFENLEKRKFFEESKSINLSGKEIEYNAIDYTFDSVSTGDEPLESRTQRFDIFILVYSDRNNINYIINRNYDALRIMRRLLGYEGRNEITSNDLGIGEDLLLWLVNKVFLNQSTFTFTNIDKNELLLTLNTITGVRGQTSDNNRLSAQGNTVMNLLSTLTFILESDYFDQLILRLEYDVHENIEVRLNNKKIISFNSSKYYGPYEDLSDDEMICKLSLLVYIDIIPKLIQTFVAEKDDNLWNKEVKETLFDDVQTKLISRLEVRKEFLSNL